MAHDANLHRVHPGHGRGLIAYAVMLAAPSSWMSVVDPLAPLIRNVFVRL
jgi:hypothetical protein